MSKSLLKYKNKKLLHRLNQTQVKRETGDWRNGSVVKSTSCSSCGPRFNSQHPNESLQLPITPVPGDLISSHQCLLNKINLKNKRRESGNIGKYIVIYEKNLFPLSNNGYKKLTRGIYHLKSHLIKYQFIHSFELYL